ncbi:MAG: PEP-CTERM sorting domain-containing protein [Phycisphaerales bacterium]|nr:PEP-CTERM sorting domain-containing protein [Phycisphaerales bacterium]
MLFGLFYGAMPGKAVDLDRGHQILLQRGFQVQGIAFPGEGGLVSLERFRQSNMTGLDTWYNPFRAGDFDETPTLQWKRLIRYGDSTELQSSETPYLSNLVAVQYGDEESLTPDVVAAHTQALAELRTRYPNAISYTNQYGTQESLATLKQYVSVAKPDMVMFDTYPFNGNTTGGSPRNFYADLQKYRQLGLGGHDGTGTRPIPYGAFMQTWVLESGYTLSESEMRLNNFSAISFGNTVLEAFLYRAPTHFISGTIQPVFFTGYGDTQPTDRFYQYAEMNQEIRNLGPAMIRLISTDVRIVPGRHDTWYGDAENTLPSGVGRWSAGADPYIKDISASNPGSKNDGLDGDVLIGYFKPLGESFTSHGHEGDVYFMIVNGLSSSTGSAVDCRQNVRIDFDFLGTNINSLLRLDRDSGLTEMVVLDWDGGSRYHLNLLLDGGTGDLFKFNNGGRFVPEPSGMVLWMVGMGFIGVRRRDKVLK